MSLLCTSCTTEGWRQLFTDLATHAPPIFALSFESDSHGWALTPSNLLRTTDGGQTWKELLKQEEGAFQSFQFVDAKTGWIVGSELKEGAARAMILKTTDGGLTWRQQDVHINKQLVALSFCGLDQGWAAGGNVIVHTSDGGDTWRQQYFGQSTERLFGISCLSPQQVWAVGEDGVVLYSEDGGETWTRQDTGTKNTLGRIRFFGDAGWIVGFNGTLLRTRDRGATWKAVELDTPEWLSDIWVNGPVGWIVGTGGTIFSTRDGGSTWKRENAPTTRDLLTLFFLDPRHGWIGGERRTVLALAE